MVRAAIPGPSGAGAEARRPPDAPRLIERVRLLATGRPTSVLARAAALREVRYVGGRRARAKLGPSSPTATPPGSPRQSRRFNSAS